MMLRQAEEFEGCYRSGIQTGDSVRVCLVWWFGGGDGWKNLQASNCSGYET